MQHYHFPTALKSLVHDDGVNAPRYHQSTIARLTAGLYPLYRSGAITLEPLPEMMLTEGYSSPVPDLILYDYEAEETRLIIEICQTNGLKADLDKVVRLIDGDLYGILEGFVYNYKTNQWLRYRKGDGGFTTASSYSDIIGLNLNDFL